MTTEELEEDLLKHGEILLVGDISEKTVEYIVPRLRYLHRNLKPSLPIKLFITTNGGDLDYACAISEEIKLLRNHGRTIYTIGQGVVASAGIFILAAGSKRFGVENTTFMIHSCSYSLEQDHQQSKDFVLFMDRVWNGLMLDLAVVFKITNSKDIKTFLSKVKNTYWLDTESALDEKIIEEKWENNEESGK